MTIEDKNFIIKNGLSVGTGKHQILDSSGRLTANYITLNSGGRYLSAGVDLWDLFSNAGIPPLSTNGWNSTHNSVLYTSGNWDSVYNWVQADSGTNNTDYNRSTFVNISGDRMSGGLEIDGDVYMHEHLRVDGHTYLSGAQYIENDSYVMGDFKVDGNVELGVEGVNPKSIYFGATNDDRVVFRADVDSNIIPDDTITYDLGTSEQQWRELFVQDISASRDIFVDNRLNVSGHGTIESNLAVSGNTTVEGNTVLSGTLDVKDVAVFNSSMFVTGDTTVEGNTVLSGTLDVKGFTSLFDDLSVRGNMYVDGNAYLSAGVDGNIYVGDVDTDNVVFRADIDSGIKPDDSVTYDLGTSDQQWRELFVQDISATRDIFIDNRLNVSGHGTIESNLAVSGNTTVEGNVVLSGTLDVEDVAVFNSSMFVTGDTTVEGNVVLSGTLDVEDVAVFNSSMFVTGDTTVEGNTVLSGTLDVEDVAVFNSSIFVTGDTTVEGNTVLSGTLDVEDVAVFNSSMFVTGDTTVEGNTVLSGTLDVKGFTSLFDDLSVRGNMYVDGNAYLSAGVDGNIYVGDVDTDNVVFRADVDSGIKPDDTVTYDLGTSNQQWRELFVQDISATRDIFIDNRLNVSGHGTVGNNFAVSGNTTVEGNTVLSGTLDVEDVAVFNSSMFVTGDTTIQSNTVLSGTLDVEDVAVFNSSMFVTGDTTVEGNTVLSGTLDVEDVAVFNSSMFVTGDTTIQSNTVLSGTLDVEDVAVFNSSMFVTGDTTIEGNTVLSGTLDIEKDTTIIGHVSAVSGMSLVGDLTADDSVFIRGNIFVEGHAYFGFGLGQNQMNLGADGVDEIVVQADIGSDLLPYPSLTYNLGSAGKRWNTLYIGNIDVWTTLYVKQDILTEGTIQQNKNIATGKSIETVDDIWRDENTSSITAEVLVETFDHNYQSVKYNIMVISPQGDVSTINADFASKGTDVNGTTYGDVNVGSTDPLKSVGCSILNNKYVIRLTVSGHAKIMITGKSMFLS